MRIRIGGNAIGNSLVGIFAGIFLIMFGLTFVLSSVFMNNASSIIDGFLPDGVETYNAYVLEVLNVEKDEEWEEDMDGYSYREIVYDCDVVLQYEVNNQKYEVKYSFNDERHMVEPGDRYEVYVHPNNPEKIYGYGSSSGKDVGFMFTLIFCFVGGVTILIGIIILVVTIKKRKVEKEQKEYEQQYSQPYNQPYNQVNTQNYNMSSEYDYGNQISMGTDYSGTSLRD